MNRFTEILLAHPPTDRFLSAERVQALALLAAIMMIPGVIVAFVGVIDSGRGSIRTFGLLALTVPVGWLMFFLLALFFTWIRYLVKGI